MDMFEMIEDKQDNRELVTAIFDLETQRSADEVGWDNIDLMYMSVGVVYMEPEGKYHLFKEDRVTDMLDLLFSADRVVSYNGLRFDNIVLSHYSNRNIRDLNSVDMYIDIKEGMGRERGPKLDSVAKATLGDDSGKNANPLDVFEWYENGDYEKLFRYCKNDVKITKGVYDFGQKHGYVYALNRNDKKVPINVRWTVRRG